MMTTELTWLGHGTWLIETNGTKLILDPFLDDNPSAPIKAADVDVEYILVSHGHFDHVSDAASIANRTGATVITNYEISEWLGSKHHVENRLGMNVGGGVQMPFGHVKMTLAFHSSMLPDGSNGGMACGFLLTLDTDKRVYFACDTALFEDMKRIGSAGLELAVVPIGDLFTMGPDDAHQAVQLLKPRRVAPAHYNTWPPIEQDAERWARIARSATHSEPVIVEPGGKIVL
jgi:L-ascorbate metabolism protein UlaG (beta-lactamase superfamily)